MSSSQDRDAVNVDGADEVSAALPEPEDPPSKRQRLAEAGRVRREFRSSLRRLVEVLAVQEGPELQKKDTRSFQLSVGMQFLELMAKQKDEEVKDALWDEFAWLLSQEFVEFFTRVWKQATG